jgi:hypothetical protein
VAPADVAGGVDRCVAGEICPGRVLPGGELTGCLRGGGGGAAPGLGTVRVPLQPEQRTCLPATEAGAVNCFRQVGH